MAKDAQRILTWDRLVAAGHDAGPDTIRWHLAACGVAVCAASIHRVWTAVRNCLCCNGSRAGLYELLAGVLDARGTSRVLN